MPGRKYGPGGKWIHDRAHGLMDERKKGSLVARYGEKKGKSIAYAIATQQAHKVGKSPKGFRTPTGVRTAKRKFDKPVKEYQKTAMLHGLYDELEKIGGIFSRMGKFMQRKGAPALKRAPETARRGLFRAKQWWTEPMKPRRGEGLLRTFFSTR